MLRRSWKPVTTAVAVAAPTYYWYSATRQSETFELPVRVRKSDGKVGMTTKTLPLLSIDEVNRRLRERATTETTPRPNGIVWNYANASLPSNDPIEDAHSKQIVQRDASDPSAPGDYVFFTVMDGHSGPDTSRLLSQILINAVSLELSKLISNPASSKSTLSRVTSLFASSADANPVSVANAIQLAFTNLDRELINAPIRIFASNIDEKSRDSKIVPDLSQHPLALKTMQPAVSGSCALMTMFDTAHEDLYVACTGDARAVAGASSSDGSWHVDVLTEDQTGRNPKEKARIQSEHPADEKDNVIRNGRVLGGLEPTRAFGDARYKWPREIHDLLNQAFMVGNNLQLRPQPSALKTPPYVTARPEVTHRKVSFKTPGEHGIRFLVMATDGLWDELTSEDVAGLVLGHLKGLKGVISKSELSSLVPTSTKTATVQGKDQRRQRGSGSWAFIDDNIGVHLIRNALGGGDETELRRLVSIPAPFSRSHRDDITVTVVWWHEGQEGSASSISTSAPKAKL
ncbi:phosphatase 2C-like domain-containing protein [Mucidula mucida]|nr:phosphatase 2C-like domain-containing protein [Mucidula mucida]